MKYSVPPAPQPSFAREDAAPKQFGSQPRNLPASKLAPLDAAFLRRVKFSTIWLGGVFTFCVFVTTHSLLATGSFFAGLLLSVLMLSSQQHFVRRVVRPKTSVPYQGFDAKIPVAVLLPAKWVIIAFGLAWLMHAHLLMPLAFVGGCTVLQVVIVAKALGRLLQARIRPLRAVYVDVHLHAS